MALMVLLSAFQLVDFAKDCGHGWQGCWPAEGRSNLRQILHRARVLYRGLVLRCRSEVPLLVLPRSAFARVWSWALWSWGYRPGPPSELPDDPRAGRAAPTRRSLPRRRLVCPSTERTLTSSLRRQVVVPS